MSLSLQLSVCCTRATGTFRYLENTSLFGCLSLDPSQPQLLALFRLQLRMLYLNQLQPRLLQYQLERLLLLLSCQLCRQQ